MTPYQTSHTLKLDSALRQSGPTSEEENSARAALEELAGRRLSDQEWDRSRARLLQFVSMLREWHQGSMTSESELVKAA